MATPITPGVVIRDCHQPAKTRKRRVLPIKKTRGIFNAYFCEIWVVYATVIRNNLLSEMASSSIKSSFL